MGRGGARPGAGAPAGGISQARRLMLAGIQRGLSYAGKAKGLEGSEEEVATEAVARIASDLVLQGRGDEVLKLYILAAPGKDEADKGQGKSALVAALGRLPGMVEGREASQPNQTTHPTLDDSDTYGTGPADTASGAPGKRPFFAPQLALLGGDGSVIEEADEATPQGGVPPLHGPAQPLHPHAKIFEKSRGDE